jgi:heat shock protein HslJ
MTDATLPVATRRVILMKRFALLALLGLVIGALALTAGCASSGGGVKSAGDLSGTDWSLVGSSLSSQDLGAAKITAAFDGTQMSGFSGVNQYSGPYTADSSSGSFKAGPLAATQMAGPEPLMAAEGAYLKLLEGCDSYKIEGGKLTLSTGGNESLTYEAAAKAELPGSKWVVTGYNNGKQAVTGPAVDSTLTVAFGTDGKVGGNGGVNTFSGTFESGPSSVKIGPLASTKMAGPPELMTQETLYLTALQNSTTWEIQSGKLTMRDATGAMQINGIKP